MKIWALWHGGSSYSVGDARDVETFRSLSAARDAMESRANDGYWQAQTFDYVARESESTLCPSVVNDSMTLWFSNPITSDDSGSIDWADRDPYPDRLMERGSRGGIVVNYV